MKRLLALVLASVFALTFSAFAAEEAKKDEAATSAEHKHKHHDKKAHEHDKDHKETSATSGK